MSEFEKDRELLSLFEQAGTAREPDHFVAATLQRIDRQTRLIRWRWISLGAVILLLEIFLLDFAAGFSEMLSMSLLDMGDGVLARLLQPVNNVAGLLAILLLSAHHFMRRFLGR